MDMELQIELKRKYPQLFSGLFRPNSRECIALFGIECGAGWWGILDELASKIEPLITKFYQDNPQEQEEKIPHVFDPVEIRVSQVKEKFGGLRFYMHGATEEMYDLINAAEDASYKTCETCGSPGAMRGKGWYYCACDSCEEQFNKKKDKS